MLASSIRPATVAAIFETVSSSASHSSSEGRTILSLQTTDPTSVSESVSPIRTLAPTFLTCPSSTYWTRNASPTLTGSGFSSAKAKLALREAT